jgi:hypothetical protein
MNLAAGSQLPGNGRSGPWDNHRSDVIRGSLDRVQGGVDFDGIEIDETQRSFRETEFSVAR